MDIDFDKFDIDETPVDNINTGDSIRVTPGIGGYVEKFNWSSTMYEMIGNVFISHGIRKLRCTGELSVLVYYLEQPWKIPLKFAEKVL